MSYALGVCRRAAYLCEPSSSALLALFPGQQKLQSTICNSAAVLKKEKNGGPVPYTEAGSGLPFQGMNRCVHPVAG